MDPPPLGTFVLGERYEPAPGKRDAPSEVLVLPDGARVDQRTARHRPVTVDALPSFAGRRNLRQELPQRAPSAGPGRQGAPVGEVHVQLLG